MDMTIETRNLIAGEWLDGAGTIANISPSDVTPLGMPSFGSPPI